MILDGEAFEDMTMTSFRMTVTAQHLPIQFMQVCELWLRDDPVCVLLDHIFTRPVSTDGEWVAPLRAATDIDIEWLTGRNVDYHEIYRVVL